MRSESQARPGLWNSRDEYQFNRRIVQNGFHVRLARNIREAFYKPFKSRRRSVGMPAHAARSSGQHAREHAVNVAMVNADHADL